MHACGAHACMQAHGEPRTFRRLSAWSYASCRTFFLILSCLLSVFPDSSSSITACSCFLMSCGLSRLETASRTNLRSSLFLCTSFLRSSLRWASACGWGERGLMWGPCSRAWPGEQARQHQHRTGLRSFLPISASYSNAAPCWKKWGPNPLRVQILGDLGQRASSCCYPRCICIDQVLEGAASPRASTLRSFP
jgi:hypothetical protein